MIAPNHGKGRITITHHDDDQFIFPYRGNDRYRYPHDRNDSRVLPCPFRIVIAEKYHVIAFSEIVTVTVPNIYYVLSYYIRFCRTLLPLTGIRKLESCGSAEHGRKIRRKIVKNYIKMITAEEMVEVTTEKDIKKYKRGQNRNQRAEER